MPPTGIRRWRPLMSSGTRAVSVGLVGISHHGWHDREMQKSHTLSVVILSKARDLGLFAKVDSAFDTNAATPCPEKFVLLPLQSFEIWPFPGAWDLGFGAL